MIYRLVFLLTSLLWSWPSAAEVFNPKSFTLDNGLQVVVVENHRTPVVHHMIVYFVGAKDEPVGKSGLTHLMEHLMFKGTPKIPNGQFSKIVQSVGGRDNAFTTKDYTAYFQSVAREYLPMVMEMEADRMVNLTLTDDIVAVERDVILQERAQRTDNDPVGAFWEDINNLLYVNHPYGIPTIGWLHEIASLTRDDVIDFYQQWYAPNNAVVILSGSVTEQEARNLAREYYADLTQKDLPKRMNMTVPVLKGKRRLVKESPQIKQPLWSRHYRAPQATVATIRTSDALLFFADIVGNSATGLLYQNLVIDQKIATSAFISYSPEAIGPARLSIIVSPTDGVSLSIIEEAVDAVLANFFAAPLTESLLKETAKSLVTESIYARDSLAGPARIIGGALATGLPLNLIEDWPKRINSITTDDVMSAAKNLIRNPNNLPVTGIMIPQGGAI